MTLNHSRWLLAVLHFCTNCHVNDKFLWLFSWECTQIQVKEKEDSRVESRKFFWMIFLQILLLQFWYKMFCLAELIKILKKLSFYTYYITERLQLQSILTIMCGRQCLRNCTLLHSALIGLVSSHILGHRMDKAGPRVIANNPFRRF